MRSGIRLAGILLALSAMAFFDSCAPPSGSPTQVLRLAVTTSTRDTGLLDVLIADFNKQHSARVDVIAVGTGQALRLGKAGDVDLVLVHARAVEDAFMEAGHGIRREDVMYNTFEVVGPQDDPAGIQGQTALEAFRMIRETEARFVSRGDDSGTHKKERALWLAAGHPPTWGNYVESGQGMGPTLIMANELDAYVLTDRGTYLKFKDKLSLVTLVQSPDELRNPYGVLVVDPAKHTANQSDLAQAFVDFLISRDAQLMIQNYRVNDEPLFYPLRLSGNTN